MKEGWFRRRFLWYFRREEVIGMQSTREGECARCGACCIGCVFYRREDSHCRIYSHRPVTCKAFPLTHGDIENIPTCGYSFED